MANLMDRVAGVLGAGPHRDFNSFTPAVNADAKEHGVKLTAKRVKLLQTALAQRDQNAEPVVKEVHKSGKAEPDPIRGRFPLPSLPGRGAGGEGRNQQRIVEYEPDPELRDTEQISLLEEGGIEAFIRREVLPHVPDAWIDHSKTLIGCEIPFTRNFYQPSPLRTLKEIREEIRFSATSVDGAWETTRCGGWGYDAGVVLGTQGRDRSGGGRWNATATWERRRSGREC